MIISFDTNDITVNDNVKQERFEVIRYIKSFSNDQNN